MFERLDPSARHALELAQRETVRFHHNYLGTEHLLIGLTLTDSFPARLLAKLDCTPDAVRSAVVDVIGRGRPREQLLATIGIDLGEVRRRAEATFGSEAVAYAATRALPRRRLSPPRWWPNCSVGAPCESALAGGWLGMAPRLKKVLELATRHAAPAPATPTHLLLGIVEEGNGVACQILERRGIKLAVVTTAAQAELS